MADVIIKLKVMPAGLEVDLNVLQKACETKIRKFGAKVIHSVNQEHVAFGLKALVFVFLLDEANSNIDILEANIKELKDAQSVQVIDVRRAIG
jgi:translation elongation factor aEF-1 beta